jgi:4-hydroxybutyrate CoA-transferase
MERTPTGKALDPGGVRRLYRSKLLHLEEALGLLRSGSRLFLSGNAATPTLFLEALVKTELRDLELVHLLHLGQDPLSAPEAKGRFRRRSLFVGSADREAVARGEADYVPISLHQIPALFRQGVLPLDAAIVQVSPPDAFGFVSLGVEVLASLAALEAAPLRIGLVNPRMPRVLGDTFVHLSRLSALVELEAPLIELPQGSFSQVEAQIGAQVASLVEDGDTLQLGIGGIPNAVLFHLEGRKDLGVHSEMISEGLVEALERGIITGARKTLHRGKVVGTFILGSERLYRFVADNPLFELHPADYVNDPSVIAKNANMVAINSAIEVDLTGQVCAESIGTKIYSGFGGQLDFIRGAAASPGGRPIIALPSRTSQGIPRIVAELRPGAGVVTTRADVHYVVTEYGVAELFGRSLRERAKALIEIAHPEDREALRRVAQARGLL